MTELILRWATEDVGLSGPISSAERDFANGYYIGELLVNLKMLSTATFDTFKNDDKPKTKISNFKNIGEALRVAGLSFSATDAHEIMEMAPGAAVRVLYDLQMNSHKLITDPSFRNAHEHSLSMAHTATSPGRTTRSLASSTLRTMVPRQPLPAKGTTAVSGAVHPSKPAFRTMEGTVMEKRLTTLAHQFEKPKHMKKYLQRFGDVRTQRESRAAVLEAKEQEDEIKRRDNRRLQHIESRRGRTAVIAQEEEVQKRMWKRDITALGERTVGYTLRQEEKALARRSQRARSHKHRERLETQQSIDEFEKNLLSKQGGGGDGGGGSSDSDADGAGGASGLGEAAAGLGVRAVRALNSARGADAKSLKQAAPSPRAAQSARSARRLRRAAVLLDQEDERERQLLLDSEDILEQARAMPSTAARELEVDLWRAQQYKRVLRENTRFETQQRREAALRDERQRLDRDANLFQSQRVRLARQLGEQEERYEEIRSAQKNSAHLAAVAVCRAMVERLVTLADMTRSYRDLSGEEEVPAEVQEGWILLLSSRGTAGKSAGEEQGQDQEQGGVDEGQVVAVAAEEGGQENMEEAAAVEGEAAAAAGSEADGAKGEAVVEGEEAEEGEVLTYWQQHVRGHVAVLTESDEEAKDFLDDAFLSKYLCSQPPTPQPPTATEGASAISTHRSTAPATARTARTARDVIVELDADAAADANTGDAAAGEEARQGGAVLPRAPVSLGRAVARVVELACPAAPPAASHAVPRLPLTLSLLGCSFSGKSVHAQMLADKFKLKVIDCRELVEEAIANARPPSPQAAQETAATPADPVDEAAPAAAEAAVTAEEEARGFEERDTGADPSDGEMKGHFPELPTEEQDRARGEAAAQELWWADQTRQRSLLGWECQEALAEGGKVTDEVVVQLIRLRVLSMGMAQSDSARDSPSQGWVLVDFPRTARQAMLLEEALSGYKPPSDPVPGPPVLAASQGDRVPSRLAPPPTPPPRTGPLPSALDLVLRLDVAPATAAARALGRRRDPVTGLLYHVETNQPDSDTPFKERLLPLEEDKDVEARLAEGYAQYDDRVQELETWFLDFATLQCVDANPGTKAVELQLVKHVSDVRFNKQNAAFERARQEAEEKRLADEEANRVYVDPTDEDLALPPADPAEATEDEAEGEEAEDKVSGAGEVVVDASVTAAIKAAALAAAPPPPPAAVLALRAGDLSGFQDPKLARVLALHWIALEGMYTAQMKAAKRQAREQRLLSMEHLAVVRKSFQALLNRPDGKQGLVERFQDEINGLPRDMLQEAACKEELHLRCDELGQQLGAIISTREREATEQLNSFGHDGYPEAGCGALQDSYTLQIQLELDLYHGSLDLAKAVYEGLKGKVVEPRAGPLPTLPALGGGIEKGKKGKGGGGDKKAAEKKKPDKKSKGGAGGGAGGDVTHLDDHLEERLARLGEMLSFARSTVVSLASGVTQDLAGGTLSAKKKKGSSARGGKPPKKSARKEKAGAEAEEEGQEVDPLRAECDAQLAKITVQLNSQLTHRLQLLEQECSAAITSLIGKAKELFGANMRTWLTEQIAGEREAVDLLLYVSRAAIESEEPLYYPFELDGREMYVDRSQLALPLPSLPTSSPLDEVLEPFNQSVLLPAQLLALGDQLQRLAVTPRGRKVHVGDALSLLMRLRSTGQRVRESGLALPVLWRGTTATEANLFKAIAGLDVDGTQLVDWRALLVSLRPLAHTPPTIEKLLEAADSLRQGDGAEFYVLLKTQFGCDQSLWAALLKLFDEDDEKDEQKQPEQSEQPELAEQPEQPVPTPASGEDENKQVTGAQALLLMHLACLEASQLDARAPADKAAQLLEHLGDPSGKLATFASDGTRHKIGFALADLA